jgi:hypothetical protein
MNLKLSTAAGTVALVTASLFSNVGAVEAAQISGSLEISGGVVNVTSFGTLGSVFGVPLPPNVPPGTDPNTPFTNLDFTNLVTSQNPVGTGQFDIDNGTGDFSTFGPQPNPTPPPPAISDAGTIDDLLTVADFTTGLPKANFLDFSFLQPGSAFDLATVGVPSYTNTGTGVTISVGVTGIFDVVGFDPTPGTGSFGSETTYGQLSSLTGGAVTNFGSFISFISTPGNTINGLSWSASLEATPRGVPEPASVVGLMALGLAGVTLRKRNQKS